MKTFLRWLIPVTCLGFSLYMLDLSYRAYAKWREYIALGDLSGAESYEIEFWAAMSIALPLILPGAFLVGRWSVR